MPEDAAAPLEAVYADDILAVVGAIMLRWGLLETAMLERLGERRATPGLFARWRSACGPSAETVREIERLAAIRHLLAHGLCGVEGRAAGAGTASVLCRREDGSTSTISLVALRATAQDLDLLRLCVAGRR
jgi:hypothetical protein